jgi:hypothetical protein
MTITTLIPSLPEPVEASATQDLTSSVPYYQSENPPFVAAEHYGEAQATDEESRYPPAAPAVSSVAATHTIVPSTTAEVNTPPEQSDNRMLMKRRILSVFILIFVVIFFLVNRSTFMDE